MKSNFPTTECLIIIVLLSLFIGLIYACHKNETEERAREYSAWCKITGNPKELSFDEWKVLGGKLLIYSGDQTKE